MTIDDDTNVEKEIEVFNNIIIKQMIKKHNRRINFIIGDQIRGWMDPDNGVREIRNLLSDVTGEVLALRHRKKQTLIEVGISVDDAFGRGVFATIDMTSGTVVERCHIITYKKGMLDNQHPLYLYCYTWDDNTDAIILGNGSLYNHSYKPNCVYARDFFSNQMIYTTIRDVKEGEELTVNYNGRPDDNAPMNDFKTTKKT